jgi:5-methylcytosine-specific restriction protein A
MRPALFAAFRFECFRPQSGVYAILVKEDLKYIGRCENLARRFGPADYGMIHARKVHRDGQATNCKINSRVLSAVKSGNTVAVYFHESSDGYFEIEAELIALLAPPWNDRREPVARTNGSADKVKAPASNRDGVRKSSFTTVLNEEFDRATALGRSFIRINAGELHRKLGGYPGPDHAMPSCCSAMRDAMAPHDRVIDSPQKGKGASLAIEYRLPRARSKT